MGNTECPVLMPGAEPVRALNSGERGVLLLHGFTGTPAEMKYLGQNLIDDGYSVVIPRYPGHGTSLQEMAGTGFADYLRCARESLIELRHHCRAVSVAGLSMGGIIGILLAREFPLEKLVLLSTPCTLKERAIYLAPLVGVFKKILWIEDPTRGVNSNEARRHYLCYHQGKPVRPAWQLFRAIKKAMKALPRLTVDTMIVQSLGDTVVPQRSIDYIYERLGSAKKEKLFLEISNHAITVDYEKDYVAGEVSRFLKS